MSKGTSSSGTTRKNGAYVQASEVIRHKKTSPRKIPSPIKSAPRPKSNGAYNSTGGK